MTNNNTNPSNPREEELKFINKAPEDKEWTAHINLLNNYSSPDRYLREIVQYARSGPFYPADMHTDLIEQYISSREATMQAEKVEKNKSYCGCPMCLHHTEAYAINETVIEMNIKLAAQTNGEGNG